MGQGLATTYAQLAVDVFGVPIERIRIVQGDTDRGTGFGSAGSRSLFVGGSAVHVAANETVDEARRLAAGELEAAPGDIEYREGRFRIAGTDRGIGLFELAARQPGANPPRHYASCMSSRLMPLVSRMNLATNRKDRIANTVNTP